ncbi:MAG: hypothetical protein ABIN89_26040 [Chitinophagaceae bacterium]
MQYEIVADKIDQNIKKSVRATTNYVSKGLQVQKLPEWRIKKINKGSNPVRHARFFFLWMRR